MNGEVPDPRRGQTPSCYENTINYIYGSNHPLEFFSGGPTSGEAYPAQRATSTAEFRRWRLAAPGPDAPDPMPIGELSPKVLAELRQQGHASATAQVTVSRRAAAHAIRDTKAPGQLVEEADIDRLPEILARPRAVLLETQRGNPMLLYVFDGPGRKAGKIVVRVRQPTDRAKETNRVTTAAYVDAARLRQSRYILLDGSLDDG